MVGLSTMPAYISSQKLAATSFVSSSDDQSVELSPLHCHRDAVPAAQAQRCDAASDAALLHRVQQGGQHARAAGAYRVAECNRAAVYVDASGIDAKLFNHCDHLRTKRFVDLEQVNVLQGPTDFFQ